MAQIPFPSSGRSWRRVFLLVGLALAMGASSLRVLGNGSDGLLGVGIALLLVTNFVPILIWRVSPVSPASVYSVLVFVGIGLGAVAWFGHPYGANPVVAQEWVTRSVFLLAAGMLAFWLG